VIKRALRHALSHIDLPLLSIAALLMLIGLAALYSASGANAERVGAQAGNILVALLVMWAVANVPPERLVRFAPAIYIVGMILLLGVAGFGEISKGARRWLDLGITRIQPSELMKIAVPLLLAWYFDRYEETLKLRHFGAASVLLFIPVGLIAIQPDLGTALMIAASGFYVLFLAGINWKILASVFVAMGAAIPIAWPMLHDYQRQRIFTLFDPAQDPLGAGYHTIQSTIALGSGGVLGKGWLNGTQAHLDFLPEPTTDFIFAVFSEEFGLLGNLMLMTLFLLAIGRGIYIASNAPTLSTRLLAGAISLTFFTYAFVNMGMVSGILPIVGVPLPLISYGGTSLVTILLGFGILMGIQTNKKLIQT
jgi:rod shape determining protein RodA